MIRATGMRNAMWKRRVRTHSTANLRPCFQVCTILRMSEACRWHWFRCSKKCTPPTPCRSRYSLSFFLCLLWVCSWWKRSLGSFCHSAPSLCSPSSSLATKFPSMNLWRYQNSQIAAIHLYSIPNFCDEWMIRSVYSNLTALSWHLRVFLSLVFIHRRMCRNGFLSLLSSWSHLFPLLSV